MNKIPELKPCPFCGGEAYLEEFEPHKHFFVELPEYPGGAMITCKKCEGRLSFSGKDAKEKVIKAWNTRVYPRDVQEAVRKETPKKPYYTRSYECAECLNYVDISDEYCVTCGQKLDWGRE